MRLLFSTFALLAVLLVVSPSTAVAQISSGITPSDISNPVSKTGYCAVKTDMSSLKNILHSMTCFLQNMILPLLFLMALAFFVWGVVKYISNTDSNEREEGQQFMVWGVIALAVMFSLWGLVNLLGVTFHIQGVTPTVPITRPQTIK